VSSDHYATDLGAGPALTEAWAAFHAALDAAVAAVDGDIEPLLEREVADGHLYVMRILSAVAQHTLVPHDPNVAAFRPMLEATRYLGAAGPDIDYDVAVVVPGHRHRVTGVRGGASYVGICLYDAPGVDGSTELLEHVDVDDLVAPDGTFVFDVEHPRAARIIVRQYFHDSATQQRGEFSVHALDAPAVASGPPTVDHVVRAVRGAAASITWNARLNRLWGTEYRSTPNVFVRQSAAEIVAAIPNPDVTYAFAWWRIEPGEALVVRHRPPDGCRYWGLQVCDRWFQASPQRRSNLNDRQVIREPDGSVHIVLCADDPGLPNWIDTSGHRTGTMFFRWLHHEPDDLPVCQVVPVGTGS
jgi:hypothetical protein